MVSTDTFSLFVPPLNAHAAMLLAVARTRPSPCLHRHRRASLCIRAAAADTPAAAAATPSPSPVRPRFKLPPRPAKEPLPSRLLSAFLGTSTVPYR